MELTFYTDTGEAFQIEIDPNMELEDVMALLEAEVRPADRCCLNQLPDFYVHNAVGMAPEKHLQKVGQT